MIVGYRYKVTEVKNEKYKLVKSLAIYPADRMLESQPTNRKYYEVNVCIEAAGHIGYVRPFHGTWYDCVAWVSENFTIDEDVDYWQEMLNMFEESREKLNRDISPLSRNLKIFVDELVGYFNWAEKNKSVTMKEIKSSFNTGIWKRYGTS